MENDSNPENGISTTSDPTLPSSPTILPSTSLNAETPLSKNARKRLLKAERFAALKAERRVRDKEKRQEKKRELAERRCAGDVDVLEEEQRQRVKRCKIDNVSKTPFPARVVIDLAFDDKMSEKEVISLCSQLAYTYSSNRKARAPFERLLCTSLGGKTLARLEELGGQYKRWHGVEFREEGYESLWGAGDTLSRPPICSKESIVYLTGDADDELEELREGETYIIGGICDHNRYKNLCLNKAREQSIRTAKLPIGKFLANLPTRKILTINQVFDILINWAEERDWSKALYAVIPKRKFQQSSTKDDGHSLDEVGMKVGVDSDESAQIGCSEHNEETSTVAVT